MDSLTTFNTRKTPQNQKAKKNQVKNNAGGFVFAVDDWTRLRRFLILGSDGGTYYTSARDLTEDNAQVVLTVLGEDHKRVVDTLVDISLRGAAPKVNPTIFALALAASHGDTDERAYALSKLTAVCRTGTHLFLFVKYVQQFRGWGRALARSVGEWYTSKDADKAAFQAVKYRNREGFTHRDVLRLSHPHAISPEMASTFAWICRQSTDEHTPQVIREFMRVQEKGADVRKVLEESENLTWEMLPSEALNDPGVWEILVSRGMPQTALMRQLPRLTRLGLLTPTGLMTKAVVNQLTDSNILKKARVHPINVLVAQRTYTGGRSIKGESSWSPVSKISDALDAAFYAAFDAVEPSGKRHLLALDVSGSMSYQISGMPLTCYEASTAMSLVQAATEPDSSIVGFTSGTSASGYTWASRYHAAVTPLDISPRRRLDDALRYVQRLNFGGTDCALPMLYAMQNKLEVDHFVVYTDSETWAGEIQPFQALRQYRDKTGIPAKLSVVGMTSPGFSIADPDDAGMMDVVGMDTSVPNLLAEFARG